MSYSQSQLVAPYTSDATGTTEAVSYFPFRDDGNTPQQSVPIDITYWGYSVYTYNHTQEQERFIEDAFSRLDDIIDLDFYRANSWDDANITIFRGWKSNDDTIGSPIEGEEGYIFVDPRGFGGGVNHSTIYGSPLVFDSEIVWRDVYQDDQFNLDEKNTILHEIGHALGLDHPDADGYNPNWDTDVSIMSYNDPPGARKEQWYSEADIMALISIWGPEDDDGSFEFRSSSWAGDVTLKSSITANQAGGYLQAPQIDDLSRGGQGSIIKGSENNDQIYCKAGWDVVNGSFGNDYIRAGNGRDLITGGQGADELWGDFGWNTFTNEKDGFVDLIAIKSDQNLVNWLYGKAGNNPNGEKADIIEGLDSNDAIKIIGASTDSLSFRNASAHGLSGIGIFAGSALEALYTGGDLSIAQIQAMTSGDASAAAMNNTLDGYGWTG